MKKLIITLFVICMIAVLGVGLTACNNATPQGQLANVLNMPIPHSHEEFVYEAVNSKDDSKGIYTVNLDAFNKGASVEFGTRTLENVNEGIRVKGVLTFGDTEYTMGCYYTIVSGTSYMTPAYSFRTVTVDGNKTFEMQGKYEGSTFECERLIGEDNLKDSAKVSGTVFDNNQFQQALRSVTTFSSGLNLTFKTPVASANGVFVATLTASGSTTTHVKDIPYTDANDDLKEEGILCYNIRLSRSTDVAGVSQMLYYAVDDIVSNGWGLKNVLVKIVEPYTEDGEGYTMQYNLKSVSLS